jgi:hypothetical protein
MEIKDSNTDYLWGSFLSVLRYFFNVVVWIIKAIGMVFIAAVFVFIFLVKFFLKIGDDLDKERRRRI